MGRLEQRCTHASRLVRYGTQPALDSVGDIASKVAVARWQVVAAESEEKCEPLGLAVVKLANRRRKRISAESPHREDAVDERRVDPAKRRLGVCGVFTAIGEATANAIVNSVEAPRRCERRVEIAERHREDNREGPLEAPTKVDECLRVLGNRGRDRRVSELHENGSPGANKVGHLATVQPRQTEWPVNASQSIGRLRDKNRQRVLELIASNLHVDSNAIAPRPNSLYRIAAIAAKLVYVRWVKWASTVSTADHIEDAVAEAAENISSELGDVRPDVVFAFASEDYAPHLSSLPGELERGLPGALVCGCSSPGVIGGAREVESERALALTAAHLPGVSLEPMVFDADPTKWSRATSQIVGEPSDLVVLCDSFTGEAPTLIEYLDSAFPEAAKVGGLAGVSGPGETSLFLGNRHLRSGSVVLGLGGNIEMVTGVAQGCRPIGAPMFITRHKGPVILELDGKPALRALDGMFASLPADDRDQAKGRLVVGLSMAVDLEIYQQGDFLIRDIGGVDPDSGAVAIAGDVTSDQILQFHLRDAETSAEDMDEVVSRHLYAEAAGALLFSCRGRGSQFYGKPNHDSRAISDALGSIPVGGFFANGEIGPIAGRTYLHAYTSAFALFRSKHRLREVETSDGQVVGIKK